MTMTMTKASSQRAPTRAIKLAICLIFVAPFTTTAFSPSLLTTKVPTLRLRAFEPQTPLDDLKDEIEPLLDQLKEENDLRERLVELPVMFTGEKEGRSFDTERWDTHRSSSRYVRLLFGVFFSVTTRRILPTVSVLGAWSAAVDLYNSVLEGAYGLPELELPLTPFELTAPILALLLVFRSDRAFDRFSLGSEYSWEITNLFKSVIREILTFTAASRFAPEERAAAYDLAKACVHLHGWIMRDHLRGKKISPAKQEIILRLAFGSAATETTNGSGLLMTKEVSHCMSAPMTPTAGISAISLGMSRRLPSMDFQESTLLESQFSDVASSLGKCEMMLRTPIPLGYTRYSVRFLWIWLSLLPFALVNKFAEFGTGTWWEDKPQPVLVFAMLFIGFIFSSIEDIAVQIEEPFSVLPLELHHKWLVQDAEQIEAMNRFVDERMQDGKVGRITGEKQIIDEQIEQEQIKDEKQMSDEEKIKEEEQSVNGRKHGQRRRSLRRKLGI